MSDVGGPAGPGSALMSSGTFSVSSRGYDVNGTSDQFTFVYTTVKGDVSFVAKLTSLQNTEAWSQAGVMIRESLAANAMEASVLQTPANGVVFRSRQAPRGSTSQVMAGGTVAPSWLRVERRSSNVTAYRSVDGVNWTSISSVKLKLNQSVLVGFAVASHSNSASVAASLSAVSLNGAGVPAQALPPPPPNVPPTVSMNSPGGGSTYSTYTAPASISLGATAADSDGSVARVDFYDGNKLLGTDTSSPYTFSWSNVAAGSYTLKAVATDNAGASTTSSAVAVTVNANTPPAVSLTSPANGSSFTAGASTTLTATASDANGTVARVDFYAGTTLLGSDTTSPYSVNWSNVPAGPYILKAVATDNGGASSTSNVVNVTVNANTPPTVSMVSPGGPYSAPASIVLAATAADSGGSVAKVDFYNGTTLLGTDTSSPYTFSWSNVPAGSYTLKAVATDNAGAATTSSPVAVTVNANTPPTVSMTSPGGPYAAPAAIALAATAADSGGSVVKVDFYNGATLLGTDTTSPYTFSWANVQAGSYTLKAVATDNFGASTTSSTVTVTVNANTPPTVSLISPSSGTSFMAPASTMISANATDTNGSVLRVDFYAGSTLVGSATTSPYSVSWSNVASGSYVLTAKAIDNAGATTTSAAVNVTVAGNQAPTVSLTSPSSGATFSAPATIALTASASDADGTTQKVDFYNGSTLIGTSTTSPFTLNWSNVAAGSYSLRAVAQDNLGATAVSSWKDITIISGTNSLSTAIFTPAVVPDTVSYYVFEVFAAGTDPATARPLATQNLGLPPVVNGECTVDVRTTISGLASGAYVATVSSISTVEGTLRSPAVAFTR